MKNEYECVIVGGGPAGMAAAIALKKLGVADMLLLDRNPRLGGILNQCIHPGFGLSRYGKDMTGPEYARALEREFDEAGIDRVEGAMVLSVSESKTLRVISPRDGCAEIRAKAIVIATGCRERTRDNLEIAGTRPAGVFTAGQAQNLINLRGFSLGGRVVIQGSGDIGLIMARRLTVEGCRVAGVFERLPYLSGLIRNKVQCLDHFGIPLRLTTQVCEIVGARRVEGVFIERVGDDQRPLEGTREYLPCDTVLFSVGLIPEVDILKGAGFAPPSGKSVAVNSHFEATSAAASSGNRAPDGIFLCGNALHIHDLADSAAAEGEAAARHVALYLRSRREFEAGATDAAPYKPLVANAKFNGAFFGQLEASGRKVCIVCPKGCMISADSAGCPKGAAYYAESTRGKFQPMTTTISLSEGAARVRVPVKSDSPVDVAEMPGLRAELRNAIAAATRPAEGSISIRRGDRELRFSLCR